MKNILEDIEPALRPPGGGIPSFSAGAAGALALQRRHFSVFGAHAEADAAEIESLWHKELQRFCLGKSKPEVILLGVPLDTGAGIRRGAAHGPRGVRGALLEHDAYRKWLREGVVLDLGDVFVNPHLLHDSMLSSKQIGLCQAEMFPKVPAAKRKKMPVSALSLTRYVLELLQERAPKAKIFVIGGDHSVAWPVSEVLAAKYPGKLGIVQPDAHTDLLKTRHGIEYCYTTWTYHANALLKKGTPKGQKKEGRVVQLGIRQTLKDKKHWESTTGVKQYWAHEINSRPAHEVIKDMCAHLKSLGIKQIYFSNDIDGTDEAEAPATGTPAAEGISSSFLLQAIEALGQQFEMVGADIMEVAPVLGSPEDCRKTTELAAQYVLACLKQQLR